MDGWNYTGVQLVSRRRSVVKSSIHYIVLSHHQTLHAECRSVDVMVGCSVSIRKLIFLPWYHRFSQHIQVIGITTQG